MAWTSPIYYYPSARAWYTFKEKGLADSCYIINKAGVIRACGFSGILRDFEHGATEGTFILVSKIGDTVPNMIAVDEGQ